ncbi:PASTA domain-containing protein [Kibdelosporangium phytohabitans]|uniref:PASTA domain-containing protein n=1 Tax=Kibdelosporangium phytohabitans TaxID=860235 RepID=UPI0019DC4FF0|nr:PASTA domain-containing protein [Kibdelosporangium phytohabitans]MBE1466362.1 beta-lactam-binding protein with PASTA domain [Kibdelosporangium phytohabitans]
MRKALLAGLLVLAACSSPPPQAPPPPLPAEAVIGQTVIPGTNAPSGHVVPDVIGKNHQEAQDTLQASGFYKLREEDATGRDRSLIIDRNWVVVEQVPKAGTVLDPRENVTLKSKKHSD